MKTALFFGLLFTAGAQQPASTSKSATPAQAAPRPAAAPAKAQGITVDGVVEMVQAGLSEDLIIASLRKENKAFDLSAADMIRLKKANVSDSLLKVMLDPKAELSSPPPARLVPSPVQIPAPVSPGVSPSAISSADSSVVGDLNDPTTPHDSGIYLYTKTPDDKPQMTVLERASYEGTKTGIGVCTLTYGLKPCKTRAIIPGMSASIRTGGPETIFYFYFEDKAAGLGKFGTGALSNPEQFTLVQLEVKNSSRETVLSKFGASGISTGADSKFITSFKSERVRPGVYRVKASLTPGQYCFLSSGMAGAAGAGDLFDFAVMQNP